jgi:hypothetical protein
LSTSPVHLIQVNAGVRAWRQHEIRCPVLITTGAAMMDASPYLSRPARALREACHETGWDAEGRSCTDCPLADLCEKNAERMAERR